jgi:hypothetical protein
VSRIGLRVWTVVVVAGAVGSAPLHAEVCVKRSRTVVFRALGCKSHEKALDVGQLGGGRGAKGPKGPAGAPGGPSVVNAAGLRIGTLSVDAGEEALFLQSPVDGSIVECFRANVDGCRRAAEVALVHEAPDCAGPPFRTGNAQDLVRNAVYRDGRLFLIGDPIDTVARQYASRETFSDAPCDAGGTITSLGSCCRNTPVTTTAGPAHIVDFAAVYGSPPFEVVP